jgi:hypothetical protein
MKKPCLVGLGILSALFVCNPRPLGAQVDSSGIVARGISVFEYGSEGPSQVPPHVRLS